MVRRSPRNILSRASCVGDNGGITLSPGFCASVFADKLGHARHLAVAPNGVVYVNTWSGRYYHDDPPPPGGFLIALQDTKGNGQIIPVEEFGNAALLFDAVSRWAQIDPFVLHGPPQALDKDVVVAAPASIHADLDPVIPQHRGEFVAGELRAPRFREGRL